MNDPVLYNKDHPAPLDPANRATREAWTQRTHALRRQVRIALGLWPMPARPTPRVTLGPTTNRDGYAVQPFRIDGSPGVDVTGSLYKPARLDRPAPLMLHAHGHAPGGRLQQGTAEGAARAIAEGAERLEAPARHPLQAASATLATMGCVVALYDMVGYGERDRYAHRVDFAGAEAIASLVTEAGLQAWNGLRILDWLADEAFVDPARIGAIGQSGGASQALLLGAIDDRPTWFFLAGMIGLDMQGGCTCENAPLLRLDTNNVELAGLIAPRAVTFASANDWTKDFASRGLPELQSIYRHFGAEDSVDHRHFDFGHNFNAHTRAYLYERAAKRFGLTVVDEARFEPIEPAGLRMPGTFDEPSPAEVTRRFLAATSPSEAEAVDALNLIVASEGVALPDGAPPLQHACYNRPVEARSIRDRLERGVPIDFGSLALPGQAKYGAAWRQLSSR